VFRVQRAQAVVAQEKAGFPVLADVLLAVFGFLADEVLAAYLRGRVPERGAVGEFEKVAFVQEDAVVTAPRAVVDTLEGQCGVEVDDGRFARMNLYALAGRC
jgi:hypothetical protein